MKTINYLFVAVNIALVLGCVGNANKSDDTTINDTTKSIVNTIATGIPLDTLEKRLVRAGELLVSGENTAELQSYFDTTKFKFHGPEGSESNYAQLTSYFKSYRAAFDNLSIRRGLIVREGNYIACQTWIEGKFVREFTLSPVGKLLPNGQRVIREIINIFRFDNQGRLVEEWVQVDNISYLRQLGAEGK